MDQYQLGKDIATILNRLERLEAIVSGLSSCKCAKNGKRCTTRTAGAHGSGRTSHGETDNPSMWATWGDLSSGDCEYRSTKITVWKNGDYEIDQQAHCNAPVTAFWTGWCDFRFTIHLANSSGTVLWSQGGSNPPGTHIPGGTDWGADPGQKVNDPKLAAIFSSIDISKSTMDYGCTSCDNAGCALS